MPFLCWDHHLSNDLSQKSGYLGLLSQFPCWGSLSQFYLLIFFISAPFPLLLPPLSFRTCHVISLFAPCLAFLLLLAPLLTERSIAVTVLNSSASPCAFHLHVDNEAPLWLVLQSRVLPAPLTPVLTAAPQPVGVGMG